MPTTITTCERCGASCKHRTDKLGKHTYCSRECAKGPREQITRPCNECGKPVTRVKSQMLENVFCNKKCSRNYISSRLSEMNRELNPDRMTSETKAKLRKARLGKGEGRTYEKTYGRHTHRIIAEEKLGRPLLPGEVVHHIDENHRNNHPDNLMIFPSQKEHAAFHQKLERWKNS